MKPMSIRAMEGEARQPARHRSAFWNCAGRRRICWAIAISPTWCWRTAWPIPATGPRQFLEDLKAKTEAHFRRRTTIWQRSRGKANLQPWDIAYYAEKQRAALYDFDEEALRPYFPLESVVEGMFEIVQRLYGIRVVEKPGVPVWDAARQVLRDSR